MATSNRAFEYALEPGLLPEQQARSLATIVGGAVTAQRLKMNRVLFSPRLPARASTVGAPRHAELPAAVFLHLRHERETVEPSFGVECSHDFGCTPYRDQFTRLQVQTVLNFRQAP